MIFQFSFVVVDRNGNLCPHRGTVPMVSGFSFALRDVPESILCHHRQLQLAGPSPEPPPGAFILEEGSH